MSWSDELPQYMRKCIADAPANDEDSVLELIARSRTGNAKATDTLVRQFMEYALSVAAAMEHDFKYRVPMEDFLQAALEGLLETIRSRFDPSRGTKFSSVAWLWMRKYCFELVARLGYPVTKPRAMPIGTVPLDEPVKAGGLPVANAAASEDIGPESATVVARSWRVILLALAGAINALEEIQRASVIQRKLDESEMLPLLDEPGVQLHRVTLWRNERLALHRLRKLLDETLSPRDVVDTLRQIDITRGINGFEASLETAYAA